ncbi:hypothetical protein B0H15DRAFT_1018416 [Mycena belliarum]|uniref:Uncharacterized protein n=1 Tax=Mycena belliarum TaxID=1033014 RepID=A0AAD6Y019_9AGAR|nr:hypothetical protein B0H15DRAFT_1018416 [Mycena belliae]
MTTFWVRFKELPHEFLARKWSIPNHTGSFVSLPPDAPYIVIYEEAIFANQLVSKRRMKLSLEQTRTWGYNGDDDQAIFAQAQTLDADPIKLFCLRMILNAERSTSDARSSSFQVFEKLVKDAEFHSNHLRNLEGVYVPLHYGMWIMDTGDWAGKVVFSLTQWCGSSWNELQHTTLNTEANRILVGRSYEALHDFGIYCGGLHRSHDFRHVLLDLSAPGMTRAQRLNGEAPCYIVDFSEARADHDCKRTVPVLPLGSILSPKLVGCREMTDALFLLKFMPTIKPTKQLLETVAWHSEYSKRHPDQPGWQVRAAQRAKLYPDMPPVHPQYKLAFADDSPYARATFTDECAAYSDDEGETTDIGDVVDGFRAESASPETISDPVATEAQPSKLEVLLC